MRPLTDVVPSIAFSRNMKVAVLVLREDLTNEHLEKEVHVMRSDERVIRHRCPFVYIAETDTCRLVDEEESSVLIPAIRIVISPIAVLIDQARAKLCLISAHNSPSSQSTPFLNLPCSIPNSDDPPGPPVIHSISGASVTFSSVSIIASLAKYQKNK